MQYVGTVKVNCSKPAFTFIDFLPFLANTRYLKPNTKRNHDGLVLHSMQ